MASLDVILASFLIFGSIESFSNVLFMACMSFSFLDWVKLFESISIIAASIAAMIGIRSWRIETRWNRKYELAEEVMSRFYEAHQVIQIIRSPFGFSEEGKSRKKSEGETEEESSIYDNAYVAYERFQKNKEPFDKLQSIKFRFITIFGKEHEKLFDELTRIVNEILFAAQEIARIQLDSYSSIGREERGKEMRELRKTIYSTSRTEDDPIEQRIQKLMKTVEGVCKKIVGEH